MKLRLQLAKLVMLADEKSEPHSEQASEQQSETTSDETSPPTGKESEVDSAQDANSINKENTTKLHSDCSRFITSSGGLYIPASQ